MSTEKDLDRLLQGLSPVLLPGEFVFCSFEQASYGEHADLEPIATVQEREGLTFIVPRAAADAQSLEYESTFRCITLNVHSSLLAVGLTAAVASKLADHGISANVLAGFHHDQIFVRSDHAARAIEVLESIAP